MYYTTIKKIVVVHLKGSRNLHKTLINGVLNFLVLFRLTEPLIESHNELKYQTNYTISVVPLTFHKTLINLP